MKKTTYILIAYLVLAFAGAFALVFAFTMPMGTSKESTITLDLTKKTTSQQLPTFEHVEIKAWNVWVENFKGIVINHADNCSLTYSLSMEEQYVRTYVSNDTLFLEFNYADQRGMTLSGRAIEIQMRHLSSCNIDHCQIPLQINDFKQENMKIKNRWIDFADCKINCVNIESINLEAFLIDTSISRLNIYGEGRIAISTDNGVVGTLALNGVANSEMKLEDRGAIIGNLIWNPRENNCLTMETSTRMKANLMENQNDTID